MSRTISHVVGFDDAPFHRDQRGSVLIVGAVFSGSRLEGVLTGKVRRDGANGTKQLARLIADSRFATHLQLIMLQGIAVAGFNVIDIHALHDTLGIPVLVLARKQPNLAKIKNALLKNVPGGKRKWQLIEQAGVMEAVAGVYVQRAGIALTTTQQVIKRFAFNSVIPEPLRTAHLIASALGDGHSRQRV